MNTNKKFYQKNWFIYLCMFFFPPAGVILMWLFNKESSTKFKGIISAIAAIWFILLLNSNPSTPADTEKTVSNEDSLIAESTTSESEISIKSTNTASESVNVAVETDLDIITRAGHPTYYGSVASSHIIWDDVPKNKIVFGDKSGTFGDETILSMSAYRNSDLIRGIAIYFSHFENPINFTIDDVLPIVSSYMPFDVIEKYYHYEGSKLLVPDDDNEKRTKYYTFSYGLTDEGSTAYYKKIHEYSGSIDIIITIDENDKVDDFSIAFGQPRWMYSLEINNYHIETWECNLIDYISEATESAEDNQVEQESIQEPQSEFTPTSESISEIHTDTVGGCK